MGPDGKTDRKRAVAARTAIFVRGPVAVPCYINDKNSGIRAALPIVYSREPDDDNLWNIFPDRRLSITRARMTNRSRSTRRVVLGEKTFDAFSRGFYFVFFSITLIILLIFDPMSTALVHNASIFATTVHSNLNALQCRWDVDKRVIHTRISLYCN